VISSAAKLLVQELDAHFPSAHNVMNAFGILYLQFWCQPNAKDMFNKHLRTLIEAYGYSKILGEGEKKMLIPPLLNCDSLILNGLCSKPA